jgi:AcrR family transcriptional regulator
MGRPRRHGTETAARLLDAAERIVESDGVEALTVRRVAEEVGTTTRAVYSVFGSKDGLFVALGRRAFDLLGAGISSLATTDDPAADLIRAGVEVFRPLVVEHPSLYRIAVQRSLPEPSLAAGFRGAASTALDGLRARVGRLEQRGELGGRSVRDATTQFHALCEGLGGLELAGMLQSGEELRLWTEALTALVRGFAATRPTHEEDPVGRS